MCVPFPYLAQTAAALQGSAIGWGAQDVSAHAKGAYTGEVAAPMLAEFGCRWVLVGHPSGARCMPRATSWWPTAPAPRSRQA